MPDIKVPELAESISEASIAQWNFSTGDEVSTGVIVATIETDKVVLEVPAPADGVIGEILKKEGEEVGSGELIARIADAEKTSAAQADVAAAGEQAAAERDEGGGAGKKIEILVPELAESVSEATLSEWHRQPGDKLSEGDVIASIETDKAVLEVIASSDGVLVSHRVSPGESVASGQVVALAEAGAPAPAAAPAAPEPPAPPADGAADLTAAKQARQGLDAREESREREVKRAAALPAARKLAAERQIDISAIPGTGRGGRVTVENVRDAAGDVKQGAALTGAAEPSASGSRSERREKMSRLRVRISQRMIESQQGTASLSTFNEIDMSAIIGLRKRHGAKFEETHGVRLGFMSFFVKSVCSALAAHPVINASIEKEEVVHHDYCDIGIAVASPRGLVVPVLRDAQKMGMPEIEKAIAGFGERAKSGKLGVDDLTGGSFTITNGGVFGSMLSTPIINPPQSAILGVHATKQRPVVADGQIVARPISYFAVTYDHRIIDGRDAVLFLVAVKEALEDPLRLLLELN